MGEVMHTTGGVLCMVGVMVNIQGVSGLWGCSPPGGSESYYIISFGGVLSLFSRFCVIMTCDTARFNTGKIPIFAMSGVFGRAYHHSTRRLYS